MKNFSIKAAFKHAWTLWKAHKKVLILSTLIFVILDSWSRADYDRGFEYFLLWVVFFAVDTIVQIGWWKMMLKIEDGESTSLGELLKHWNLFWKYLGTAIVNIVIVLLGLILFIIPGIYFAIKYQFAMMIMVDKNCSIKEAFKRSAELTDGVKWKLFGLGFVMVVVNLAGALALVVGLLISIPVSILAYIHVYRVLSKHGSA